MKLTENQARALAQYPCSRGYAVPPENQGQIVTVGWAVSDDYIYAIAQDGSDQSVQITAYTWPAAETEWEPWNGEPETGRRVGIIYTGPSHEAPGLPSSELQS